MADMRSRHEKIIAADHRRRAWGRAAMNLHIFSNDVASAYPKISLLAAVSFVLGRPAERRAGMDLVIFANFRPAREVGVRHHARPAAYLNRPVDHHVGAYLNVGIDLCLGIDDCGWMNLH